MKDIKLENHPHQFVVVVIEFLAWEKEEMGCSLTLLDIVEDNDEILLLESGHIHW